MRKLTNWEKIGYGFGDVGNSITFTMSAMFLMMFYTDVLKISAASAGILFFVARLWDAVADAAMGTFLDYRGTRSKAGKFRPFLIKGSWPVLVIAILMFTAPDFPYNWKIIWAYGTYILWGMAYTFINIPYGSLASVMTDEPRDRAALSVTRSVGSILGGLLPQIIVVPLYLMFANPKHGWFFAMTLMAIVAFIGYIVCYYTSVEQIQHSRKEQKASLKEVLHMIRTNRPFWGVSLGSIAIVIYWMLNGALAIYYFKLNLHAEIFYGMKGVLGVIPTLLLSLCLTLLVAKYGNKKLSMWGSAFAAVSFLILLVLPDNIYLYLIFFFIASIALAFPNMLFWMMISDSIEYGEWKSGRRQEGIIYAAYSFLRKTAQAFSGLIAGMGLSIVGYQPGILNQSASTLSGIKYFTVGVPMICLIIAFLAYKFIYNLTPEKYKEITKELAEKREQNI